MSSSVAEHADLNAGTHARSAEWLRNPSFDLTLIVGVALLALCSGLAIVLYPAAFPVLLFLDLWFLGYHHVIATFTRLAFDVESFRQHRFLIVWVPILLVVTLVPLVLAIGPWVLATMYLYWQWFHYTRQSYGISRIFHRRANPGAESSGLVEQAVIYLPALW